MITLGHMRNMHEREMALVVGNSPWRTGFPIHIWNGPLIVCNHAFLELPRRGYVCVSDVETMEQVFQEPEADQHTFITPRNLAKANLRALIDGRNLKHVAVEDAWKTEPTSGAMALGLAGWLGCSSLLAIGFSCDTTHVKAKGGKVAPGANARGIEAVPVFELPDGAGLAELPIGPRIERHLQPVLPPGIA